MSFEAFEMRLERVRAGGMSLTSRATLADVCAYVLNVANTQVTVLDDSDAVAVLVLIMGDRRIPAPVREVMSLSKFDNDHLVRVRCEAIGRHELLDLHGVLKEKTPATWNLMPLVWVPDRLVPQVESVWRLCGLRGVASMLEGVDVYA